MVYIPPSNDNLFFNFNSSGYTPPDFNAINFKFDTYSVSNLKMMIAGGELQRDYLKDCTTYVLGYNKYNVQILRKQCTYGGIRDLGASLLVESDFGNLGIYIKTVLQDQKDFIENIKGCGSDSKDIHNTIKGWSVDNTTNLSAYITQTFQSSNSLSAFIHTFQISESNMPSSIKGWKREASLDLLEAIKGTTKATEEFASYIKSTEASQTDLPLNIHKIWQQAGAELDADLHGWATFDLGSFIQVFNYTTLLASIRATYLVDLPAFLRTIQPIDIAASIMGWAALDLGASIASAKSPYDFRFSIYGVPSVNLPIFIQTRLAVASPLDLPACITSYYMKDLAARINAIKGADLAASIVARGFSSNLRVKIYPKVVYIKTIINVSYLENRDLKAVINFPCYGSGFRDLSFDLYSRNSSNLRFNVFGTDGSNIKDLPITVNAASYRIQDTLKINYFNQTTPIYTSLSINYNNRTKFFSVDTLNIKTTFSQSDLPLYTRTPGNLAADSALRFVEQASPQTVVDLYKTDRTNWVGAWFGTPYGGTGFPYAFDDDQFSASGSYDTNISTPYSFRITLKTPVVMTAISYKVASGSVGFNAPFILSVKTNEEDDWVVVEEYDFLGNKVITHSVDITNFSEPVGFIDLSMLSNNCSVYDISGYSNYTHEELLVKKYYGFEEELNSEWDLSIYLNRVPYLTEYRGSYVLENLAITPNTYLPLGTLAPHELRLGSKVDYFEYYYMLKGDSENSLAVKLLNFNEEELISISTHDGMLVSHTEEDWSPIAYNYPEFTLFSDVTDPTFTIGQEQPQYPGAVFSNQFTNANFGYLWYCFHDGAYDTVGWIGQLFDIPKVINEYVIHPIYHSGRTVDPKSWTFEASSDGNIWLILDTITNQTFIQGEAGIYRFENETSYLYYRINVSENNGSVTYLAIQELEFGYSNFATVALWCRVRLDFNWENNTTSITWQRGEDSTTMIVEDIPLNTLTKDLCYGGSTFHGSSWGTYYTSTYAFNNTAASTLSHYFDSGDTANSWVGYDFKVMRCIKRIRILSHGDTEAPYKFEVHASNAVPAVGSGIGDTLLLSIDQTSNPGFWGDYTWNSFDIDNDESYQVYWITSPTRFATTEIEMFGLIPPTDNNLCSVEIRLHNNNDEDDWGNGWGGSNGRFCIDDFYMQKLNYLGVLNKQIASIGASIIGDMIPIDLQCSIRPYINRNYTNPNTVRQVIVLKLKDNIEDWRKYVGLTFNNYIKSYYYFSGDQQAYKEFRDDHWEVRVEGYSLLDVPKGLERTKLRTKYLFNLKRYDSIDVAIRDMIDRVTLLRDSNLACSITPLSSPSKNLNATIKVHRIYKSNRVLPVFITGET